MRRAPSLVAPAPRRGTVYALVATALIPILGVVALVLDAGLLMANRRQGQSVADAAALAAASYLYTNQKQDSGLDPNGRAAASALAIAAANGYANDGTTSTVTVNIPPQTGAFTGKPYYAEVIVQHSQARGFSALWGGDNLAIQARSVARGRSVAYSDAGFLVLDPTGQGALTLSGGTHVITNATVVVDSNSSKAVVMSSSANVNATATNITGYYSLSGGSSFTGPVNSGVAPTPDPLAGLPEPDPSTMTVQSTSTLNISGGAHTLYPGVYNGGISVSSGSISLQPGIYYMNGGGFKINGSSSAAGQNVMIYNEPVASGDIVTVTGTGSINITPPATGPYAGISFFQDRTAAAAPAFSGGSNFNVTGTFYFAAAKLSVTGSSTAAVIGSQYISKDLTLTGSAALTVTWDLNNVARKRSLTLVE